MKHTGIGPCRVMRKQRRSRQRLRAEFETKSDIAEKLGLGRQIESFLDRAAEYDRRIAER